MNQTNAPTPSNTARNPPSPIAGRPWIGSAIQVVFWSWHALWLLGVAVGIGPLVLPSILIDAFVGQVPLGIVLSAVGLTALPILTACAGWRLRSDPRRLLRLFYGVGGVAAALLIVRLFLIRQSTAAVDLLLGTLAFGVAFYAAELFGGFRRAGATMLVARMLGGSALLIIGAYVGVTLGLYAIPGIVLTGTGLVGALGSMLTDGQAFAMVVRSPFIAVFVLFVFYSFTLLLGLPLAVAILYAQGWRRALRAFSQCRPSSVGLALTAACIGVWIVVFNIVVQQPQREVFERLAHNPVDRAAQDDNRTHEDTIRAGLLNAYLAPHRYWGAGEGNDQLSALYRDAFGTMGEAIGAQRVFDVVGAPLLYDGENMLQDRALAEQRYAEFFDLPLQQAERDAVLRAVAATHDRAQAEAGLLDIGQRKVLLTEQGLTLEVVGDIGRFTLHEVYENQTSEPQEIFYYFNLPEHAAVTSLSLEDAEGFVYQHSVAPRGAAQQVYRDQRDRKVDPALLEQVGPRQYRLRAFPIPPARVDGSAAPLHLRLQWTVLSDGEGWATPQLAQARNVYADRDTVRTVDGSESPHAGWLPPRVDAPAPRRPHAATVGGYDVTATPVRASFERPPGSLAVVLESSRSMEAHARSVQRVLQQLRDADLDVDLYLAPSPWSAQTPRIVALDEVAPVYYGGHTLDGVLAQFESLRGSTPYAAIVVISDADATALDSSEVSAPPPTTTGSEAPLWILHLGGLAPVYSDAVGDRLVATGGGVATELDEVLQRLGVGTVDGYDWSFSPSGPTEATAGTNDAFAPIAARALVGHIVSHTDRNGRGELDAIHAIAVSASVVTPWSSMLVLVNDQQREALRRASQAADRFERETEDGVEVVTTPVAALELAATPEPEEWALLLLVSLGLLWRIRSM